MASPRSPRRNKNYSVKPLSCFSLSLPLLQSLTKAEDGVCYGRGYIQLTVSSVLMDESWATSHGKCEMFPVKVRDRKVSHWCWSNRKLGTRRDNHARFVFVLKGYSSNIIQVCFFLCVFDGGKEWCSFCIRMNPFISHIQYRIFCATTSSGDVTCEQSEQLWDQLCQWYQWMMVTTLRIQQKNTSTFLDFFCETSEVLNIVYHF